MNTVVYNCWLSMMISSTFSKFSATANQSSVEKHISPPTYKQIIIESMISHIKRTHTDTCPNHNTKSQTQLYRSMFKSQAQKQSKTLQNYTYAKHVDFYGHQGSEARSYREVRHFMSSYSSVKSKLRLKEAWNCLYKI